jgi:hypothetical protein
MNDREILKIIQQDIARIMQCLYGNDNPGRGITDRLSVVENQQKWMLRHQKWMLYMGGAIIALLLAILGMKEIPKFF